MMFDGKLPPVVSGRLKSAEHALGAICCESGIFLPNISDFRVNTVRRGAASLKLGNCVVQENVPAYNGQEAGNTHSSQDIRRIAEDQQTEEKMSSFVEELSETRNPDPSGDVFDGIFKEYERVILQSLVTSFGLDAMIRDQYGGDVDTVHNVRKIGSDSGMDYKNAQNAANYENRGKYDSAAYHGDPKFTTTVKKAKTAFDQEGKWVSDAYVPDNTLAPRRNPTISRERQGQLDHVIPASRVHNDRGRVLSGVDGKELANSPTNLVYTNAALNRNKSDMTNAEYIDWAKQNPDRVNYNGNKGDALPDNVIARLQAEEKNAGKTYNAQIAKTYYTSPEFLRDTARAAGKVGIQMGIRQALGFVFVEVWIACREEQNGFRPG